MATVRGRDLGSMGGFLTPYMTSGGEPTGGQPVMIRMQGVPTMPGYRDRPGKWNFARLSDRLRRLLQSPARSEA